jgi:hypothetical protein
VKRSAVAGCLVAVLPAGALGHPIEPLVAGSPMPVPRDWIAADVGYIASHEQDHVDQTVPFSLAAGIGGHAELLVGGSIDARSGTVGPLVAGGKLLLVMEGASGLDLAVSATVSSAGSAAGSLLGGRTVLPGLYVTASAQVAGTSADSDGGSAPARSQRRPSPLHSVDAAQTAADSIAVRTAAAVQWAPRPRILPTLEAQWTRTFADGAADHTEVQIVPELIGLLEINHLGVKLAVPVGVTGSTDIAVLASLDWQR